MRIKLLLPGLLVCISMQLLAQTATVQGTVVDDKTGSPLIGVHVRLTSDRDTLKGVYVETSPTGKFQFATVAYGAYTLEVSYLGYRKMTRALRVDRGSVDVGELKMSETLIALGEVVSRARTLAAEQKADTTEFNARAFKTNPDASAEDLVGKMPGVTVESGTVKSQGEEVQRVLVDGKQFFGNDPTVALRNLPAETIERIQIFDKLSDQAEFTGFDDGQATKTMNIVTRPDRRNSQFGKTYAGYGNDDRYQAGGTLNFFREDMRVSLIGLSNNINQQNFSMQDLLGLTGRSEGRGGSFGGGGGRRGVGGSGGSPGGNPFGGGSLNNFLVGQQNGIASTHSVGANFTDTWWTNLSVMQSYFFNSSRNDNAQMLQREYVSATDSSTFYGETTDSESKNYNHRLDTRLEWKVDSSNSLIATPRLYFQDNRSTTVQSGSNRFADATLLSRAFSNTRSENSGYTFSGQIVYRHKFETPGRTVSIDVNGGKNRKDGSGAQQSLAEYFTGIANANDTVDLQSSLLTEGSSVSTRLVYTEPILENSQLQVTYNPSYSKNKSDNRKFDFDPLTQSYSTPVADLSNAYGNTYTAQNGSLGFRLRKTEFTFMADVAYQKATLSGAQVFPYAGAVEKHFYNVLPSAQINYKFSDRNNLRVNYRSSTRPPGISQLQNVVDNTNPLLLSSGNPELRQSYTHTLMSRYGGANPREGQSLFALFALSFTNDYIANATFTASRDTTIHGVRLSPGTQLTSPINLDGYWSLRSFLTYAFPMDFIGSNLNLNGGYTYARTPGFINSTKTITNNSTLSAGVVASSNISENVDFTVSYSGNYTIARNSLRSDQNSNYFNHTASAKLNLTFPGGFVFRNETFNVLYRGLGSYDRNTWLWNMSFGKKVFENDRGELRVAVTDMLDQNNSVNRSVTETYIEDSESQVLGRYVMVVFTYTVR